jgi:hypothetical protein
VREVEGSLAKKQHAVDADIMRAVVHVMVHRFASKKRDRWKVQFTWKFGMRAALSGVKYIILITTLIVKYSSAGSDASGIKKTSWPC